MRWRMRGKEDKGGGKRGREGEEGRVRKGG